ncbi:unnamed protein product [Larinioides sclopetarius]|uniref:Uncharacterized protein n=1 Tax=Larinioides sclopetarius TaxID=280406 RepID=A0AAV2ACH0_9ARAC
MVFMQILSIPLQGVIQSILLIRSHSMLHAQLHWETMISRISLRRQPNKVTP